MYQQLCFGWLKQYELLIAACLGESAHHKLVIIDTADYSQKPDALVVF